MVSFPPSLVSLEAFCNKHNSNGACEHSKIQKKRKEKKASGSGAYLNEGAEVLVVLPGLGKGLHGDVELGGVFDVLLEAPHLPV